jgi:hypothetical protein
MIMRFLACACLDTGGLSSPVLIYLLFTLLIIALPNPLIAGDAEIAMTGNWLLHVNASDIERQSGKANNPGSECSRGTIMLDLNLPSGNNSYAVHVRRSGSFWPADWRLSVHRSSNQSGNAQLFGGESWQLVDTIGKELFSVTGDRARVPLILRINGISLKTPPGTYSTTLTYTVVAQ